MSGGSIRGHPEGRRKKERGVLAYTELLRSSAGAVFPAVTPPLLFSECMCLLKGVKLASARVCACEMCTRSSLCLLDGMHAAGSMFVLFACSVMIPSQSDGIRSHDLTAK